MIRHNDHTEGGDIMSYAQVNGLNMYCEVRGSGRPLVVLHGGFSNIETDFGPETADRT